MKRIYLLIILSWCMFTVNNGIAQLNWQLLNTGTTKNIRDISFINDSVGFIVGDNGLFKMTVNSGATWTDMTIPSTGQGVGNNGNINIAHFYDYGGNIGGVFFFEKFTAVNRTYNLLVDGWMEECGGGLFQMDDSICSVKGFYHGSSFEQYTAGSSCLNGGGQLGYFGGFCFTFDSINPQPGFTGWNDVILSHEGKIITVGASGRYSRSNTFGPKENYQAADTNFVFVSIDQSDSTTIYMINDNIWWSLYKSDDGGITFDVDSSFQPTFFYPVLRDIDFTDNDWGVMVGAANSDEDGMIITRASGSWSGWDYFMTDTVMTTVHVVDSNLAFAGGLDGKLYRFERSGSMGVQNEPELVDFTIYPNPVSQGENMINISIDAFIVDIEIFDIGGRKISDQAVNGFGNIQWVLGINSPGTYIVRINTDKGFGLRKLIVQ